jgi:glucosamine--fructose-6-phosphate aminotransferase (isomerizing)
MCGIVGLVGREPAAGRLFAILRGLEYRGYDSAGLATIVDGTIARRRARGKLNNLQQRLLEDPLPGCVGIGHTRWATHGAPTEDNAHPHTDGDVAVVHNGIIENFRELKAELAAAGHGFATATDTEVVVHLVRRLVNQGLAPDAAVRAMASRLTGAFALAILIRSASEELYVARHGSPLAIGYGADEMFVGSDALALAPLTGHVTYLEDGDVARITLTGATVWDGTGAEVNRPIQSVQMSGAAIGKAGHRHFMHKEIHEQPAVCGDWLRAHLDAEGGRVGLEVPDVDFGDISKLTIVACGTAYYAGCIARYWFESVAKLPCEVEIASEFRYRDPTLQKAGITLAISQSGETADTLAALRHAKAAGQRTLAVVNVPMSTMTRLVDHVVLTQCGPEVGVATTKAFTSQLSVLAALVALAGRQRGALDAAGEAAFVRKLLTAPQVMADLLQLEGRVEAVAPIFKAATSALFLGRGTLFPLALEGALKLKELSYIHAEGYAAGEMKHGPIALIDEGMPVIVLAPTNAWFEKTASNLQEALARGGRAVVFTDAAGAAEMGLAETGDGESGLVLLPAVDPLIAPIVYALPMQMLAYHVAVMRGTDVDQPRNLAKSVTVE